jgi:hypothetical protein
MKSLQTYILFLKNYDGIEVLRGYIYNKKIPLPRVEGGFLRFMLEIIYAIFTFTALGPFLPCSTS